MNINAKKAQDKLSQELSAAKLGKYAQAVAKPTLEALSTFCEQNEEFAQAVLQTDRTFAECAETLSRVQGEVFRISRSTAEL